MATADSDRANVSGMATLLDAGHFTRKPDSGERVLTRVLSGNVLAPRRR
jgi:hypothetical protein